MTPIGDQGGPKRKRRTREHVIEDLSENHLERKVLLNGHVLRRPERDYGVDVTMFHFGDDGAIENGEVRFQLKATDSLNLIKNSTVVSIPIETGDLHYWALEIYPFILIVFDAKSDKAYWLHIQEYIRCHPNQVDPERETVNVHLPIANEVTENAIETFRSLSLQIVENLSNQKGFRDASRKPK